MSRQFLQYLAVIIPTALIACAQPKQQGQASVVKMNEFQTDTLPAPYTTKSARNFSKVIGWKEGEAPVAPAGFSVSRFATGLENPRWIYQSPNNDIFIAETNTVLKGVKKLGAKISRKIKTQNLGVSADRILLFRDADRNGSYETAISFAEDLNQPLGMLVLNDHFYIANTDGLYRYNYTPGDTVLRAPGTRIVNLPAGGYNNHWTRNIIANESGTKIYITVGSGSNVGENGMENEIRRANILEINPDGTGEKIYASGLRNPVGMGWEPTTKTLWTAVNERDGLGDDLVPDYATGVIPGAFYGWPYAYFGKHEDPRMKDDPHPELVQKTLVPDINLGSHTASLGMAFYTKTGFPARYRNGLFIGQHGSWNRSHLARYAVMFIPFANGKPAGAPENFLTGFIADESKQEVRGRPVGVTVLSNGTMLVADDASNTIWAVKAK
ncbi:MAG: sorbosone dehydrogenase family protein [Ferruginibacter sp.]